MPKLLSVAEAARRLGVRPRDISDGFYQGRLPDKLSQVVAGRRVIDESSLSIIGKLLRCHADAAETRGQDAFGQVEYR